MYVFKVLQNASDAKTEIYFSLAKQFLSYSALYVTTLHNLFKEVKYQYSVLKCLEEKAKKPQSIFSNNKI